MQNELDRIIACVDSIQELSKLILKMNKTDNFQEFIQLQKEFNDTKMIFDLEKGVNQCK